MANLQVTAIEGGGVASGGLPAIVSVRAPQDPDKLRIFLDTTLVGDILTSVATIHSDGTVYDPDDIVFNVSTGGPSLTRTSGILSGKVTKQSEGIFVYVDDLSNFVKGDYLLTCDVVIP